MQRVQAATVFELPTQPALRRDGVMRGVSVRLRSVVACFIAGIHSRFSGDITLHRQLCEQARCDANALMAGITEAHGYGTAARVSEQPLVAAGPIA